MMITPIGTIIHSSSLQSSNKTKKASMSFGAKPPISQEPKIGLGKKLVEKFKILFKRGEEKVKNVVQPTSTEVIGVAKVEHMENIKPPKVFYQEDGKTLEAVIEYGAHGKPVKETFYDKDGKTVLRSFEKEYSPETGRLIKEIEYEGTKLAQIMEMDSNAARITKVSYYEKDGKTLDRIHEYTESGMNRRIQYRPDGKTISSIIEYQGDITKLIGYRQDWKTPNMKEEYNAGGLFKRVFYMSDGSIAQITKFNTRTGEEKLRITNIGNGEFETDRL